MNTNTRHLQAIGCLIGAALISTACTTTTRSVQDENYTTRKVSTITDRELRIEIVSQPHPGNSNLELRVAKISTLRYDDIAVNRVEEVSKFPTLGEVRVKEIDRNERIVNSDIKELSAPLSGRKVTLEVSYADKKEYMNETSDRSGVVSFDLSPLIKRAFTDVRTDELTLKYECSGYQRALIIDSGMLQKIYTTLLQ